MINKLISKTQVRLLEYDGNPSQDYKDGYCRAINDVLDLEPIPTLGADEYEKFKADYKNRLKADMVAMLTEIQLEIEELDSRAGYDGNGMPTFSTDYIRKKKVNELIQQKIDSLKGVEKMGTSNAFLKVRTFVKNCPVSIIGSDSTVMVARLVDNELWYYGLYDTWDRAEEVAKELGNGVAFEIDSLEGNK